MYGDPTFGGASALWNLMKERDLLTFKPLEARQAREASQAAQAAALGPKMGAMYESRPTYAAAPVNEALKQEQDMHRFRRAAAPLPQDVQAKLKTGGYDPVVEEEDEYASLLRMMFFKSLLDQTAGGDPPTPYRQVAGPAARDFPTMPSMFG
jgi:hypothetical protein